MDIVPEGGRAVFLVGTDAEITPVGGTLRLYGHGLSAPDVQVDQDEIGVSDVDDSLCTLPVDADAVLIDGISAEVCYRAYDRLDIRMPNIEAGAHYLVVRSGGQQSNALVVYVSHLWHTCSCLASSLQ